VAKVLGRVATPDRRTGVIAVVLGGRNRVAYPSVSG
jgi:hypothetical protein